MVCWISGGASAEPPAREQLSPVDPSQLAAAAHAAEEDSIPARAQLPAASPPQAAVGTAGSNCTPTVGVPERTCLPSSPEQLGRASLADSAGAWTPLEGVPERFEELAPQSAAAQPTAEQPAGRHSGMGSAQQSPLQAGSALPVHSGDDSTGVSGDGEGAEAGTAAQPDQAAQADGRLGQAEQAEQSPADVCGFFGAFNSAPDVADTPTPASSQGEDAADEVFSQWYWPHAIKRALQTGCLCA